jgi:hypothetical protein
MIPVDRRRRRIALDSAGDIAALALALVRACNPIGLAAGTVSVAAAILLLRQLHLPAMAGAFAVPLAVFAYHGGEQCWRLLQTPADAARDAPAPRER